MKSCIKTKDGVPALFVDGIHVPEMAYTTYFQENNRYEDFIRAGYRIFFINISFTRQPINCANTGFCPFLAGVYDDPDKSDYSELEDYVEEILQICPDALIVPRIYISMPQWWVKANPDETFDTPKGGRRELIFSDAFRKDGSALLLRMVRHIRNSSYSKNILGYQICGGQTQEWFCHDHFGCLSPAAEPYYRAWVKEKYGEDATLPVAEDFTGNGAVLCENENAKRYAEFCNTAVTESITYFAKALKEEINFEQIVGAFYGYSFDISNPLTGSHALRLLLDSPYVDFFCSPNAYSRQRTLGIDWKDQFPVDSLKLHGKLCFIECDIRTYLTKSIQESRPGVYPEGIYIQQQGVGASVWSGPPTPELSREALRKCFSHQVSKASAIWWFDMWGGWYDDPILMDDLNRMNDIYINGAVKSSDSLSSELIFFADERAYANVSKSHPVQRSVAETHIEMGNTGVPYDTYLVEDASEILENYKAAIFSAPVPSEAGKKAMELCRQKGIPYLTATLEHHTFNADEIREFLKSTDVHIYNDEKDVIYAGYGYFAIHAATAGEKHLKLPTNCHIVPIFGSDIPEQDGDEIVLNMYQYQTALFNIIPHR